MGPDGRTEMKGTVKTEPRNTPLLKTEREKRLPIIIFTTEP